MAWSGSPLNGAAGKRRIPMPQRSRASSRYQRQKVSRDAAPLRARTLGLSQTCIAVQGVAGTGGLDPSSVKGGWEQCHRVSISKLLADDATCYYSELLPACRESRR